MLITFSEFSDVPFIQRPHFLSIKITFLKSLTSYGESLVNIMFTGKSAVFDGVNTGIRKALSFFQFLDSLCSHLLTL